MSSATKYLYVAIKCFMHIGCRIHFAGTESATAFCGYMNGAVQSGIRAATEVSYSDKGLSVPRRGNK